MKLGQVFSYAAPMGAEAANALASLQDSVEPMAPGEAAALTAELTERLSEEIDYRIEAEN